MPFIVFILRTRADANPKAIVFGDLNKCMFFPAIARVGREWHSIVSGIFQAALEY
jgi:hypothetical protein